MAAALCVSAPLAQAQTPPLQPLPVQPAPTQPAPAQPAIPTAASVSPPESNQPPPTAINPAATPRPSPFTLGLRADVVASDNAALAAEGQQRKDLVTTLSPRLNVRTRGAGLKADVDASLTARVFANESQPNRVVPNLNAAANATLVERWLYLDGAARVSQAEPDPFAAPLGEATSPRGQTERQLQLTPYVRRELPGDATLLARYGLALSEGSAGSASRRTDQTGLVRLERAPLPLGGALEWQRLDSRKDDDALAPGYRSSYDTLRATATVRLAYEFDAGIVAGTESIRVDERASERDPIYGVAFGWHPGPRTDWRLVAERRFFGTGGSIGFRHRMPFLAVQLDASRGPATGASLLGASAAGVTVTEFLDAILTTRHPDEGDRRAMVDSVVQQRGVDTALVSPRAVHAGYPQLVTGGRATLVLYGARQIAVLSAGAQSARTLEQGGGPLANPTTALVFDSRQYAAQLDINHRLSRLLSLQAGWRWSSIDGLGSRAGEQSRSQAWRASVSQQLSLRTTASAGVQHQRFDTTAVGLRDFRATSLVAGVNHRF